MSPSETQLILGSLLWIFVIHFGLSRQNHPVPRMILILAFGAFFFWLDQNRPEGFSHNVMWVAPVVGLVINLWGIVTKLDKRAVISLLIGGLIIGLMVWAVIPANTTSDDSTTVEYQLPPKEQLITNSDLAGPPPISRLFFYKNIGED